MLNKVILTGFVESVAKEDKIIYFSVPSGQNVLHMEMGFSEEIVGHVDELHQKGQTIISVEGSLVVQNNGLTISPSLVETYLVENKKEFTA